MNTCLLLPAYNESRTIGQIIQEASEFIRDIIVIDDGSSDSTGEIAAACGAVCLTNATNRGKGFALRKGFAYALAHGYDLILTMDSDGQHEPADLPRFLALFDKTHPDILIGARVREVIPEHADKIRTSRFHTNSSASKSGTKKVLRSMPLHRRINNWLVSQVGSRLCRQRVPDFQSGYRLIRASVLREVRLETTRYETEAEILIKAGQLGFRIESVPIQTRYGAEVSYIKPLREMWLFTRLLLRSLGNHTGEW